MKKAKKIISVVLLLSLALCMLSCSVKKVASGVEDGVFTIAMECGYAPYNWSQPDDSNGAVPISGSNLYANGYDVIIAKKICEENGWELEIKQLDWDSLIPAILSGEVDATIAGQSMTAERLETVDFAGPYMYADVVVVTLKDSPYASAESLSDLSGGTCCAQTGSIMYMNCLPQIPDINLLPAAESTPALLMALESGTLDFIAVDRAAAQGALIAYPDMVIVELGNNNGIGFDVSEDEINIGIALNKGNDELCEKINAVLDKMTAEDFNEIMSYACTIQPLNED